MYKKKKIEIEYKEDPAYFDMRIKTRSSRYMTWFVKSESSVDMLKLKLFPNAKEITESFAAMSAAKLHSGFKMDDSDVWCYSIADGGTPRTAATVAFHTKWSCVSVDPLLYGKTHFEEGVRRLRVMGMKFEDMEEVKQDKVVIMAVHAHVDLNKVVAKFDRCKRVCVIAMPCCYDLSLDGVEPILEYEDWGVFSPERTIKIWRR